MLNFIGDVTFPFNLAFFLRYRGLELGMPMAIDPAGRGLQMFDPSANLFNCLNIQIRSVKRTN